MNAKQVESLVKKSSKELKKILPTLVEKVSKKDLLHVKDSEISNHINYVGEGNTPVVEIVTTMEIEPDTGFPKTLDVLDEYLTDGKVLAAMFVSHIYLTIDEDKVKEVIIEVMSAAYEVDIVTMTKNEVSAPIYRYSPKVSKRGFVLDVKNWSKVMKAGVERPEVPVRSYIDTSIISNNYPVDLNHIELQASNRLRYY